MIELFDDVLLSNRQPRVDKTIFFTCCRMFRRSFGTIKSMASSRNLTIYLFRKVNLQISPNMFFVSCFRWIQFWISRNPLENWRTATHRNACHRKFETVKCHDAYLLTFGSNIGFSSVLYNWIHHINYRWAVNAFCPTSWLINYESSSFGFRSEIRVALG